MCVCICVCTRKRMKEACDYVVAMVESSVFARLQGLLPISLGHGNTAVL